MRQSTHATLFTIFKRGATCGGAWILAFLYNNMALLSFSTHSYNNLALCSTECVGGRPLNLFTFGEETNADIRTSCNSRSATAICPFSDANLIAELFNAEGSTRGSRSSRSTTARCPFSEVHRMATLYCAEGSTRASCNSRFTTAR